MNQKNLQNDCNHNYEFEVSRFEDMKWINYYKCRLCGKPMKIYNSNLRHDRR